MVYWSLRKATRKKFINFLKKIHQFFLHNDASYESRPVCNSLLPYVTYTNTANPRIEWFQISAIFERKLYGQFHCLLLKSAILGCTVTDSQSLLFICSNLQYCHQIFFLIRIWNSELLNVIWSLESISFRAWSQQSAHLTAGLLEFSQDSRMPMDLHWNLL